MWPNPEDLVTLTLEILNEKLRFLCSDVYENGHIKIKILF